MILLSAGRFSFFFFENVCLGKEGDNMFELIFDILILSIELISLIFQIIEYKKNNRTADVVVIEVKIN